MPNYANGYKSEARNPKSETIPNDQNSNIPNRGVLEIAAMPLFLSLENLIFKFVSYFDLPANAVSQRIFWDRRIVSNL